MTDLELQKLVEQISWQNFHRPFAHQAKFNGRLRTTGGRYFPGDHHLDFNPRFVTYRQGELLPGIIRHELCHYHLDLLGLPHDHRAAEFRQLLKEVGGLRFVPQIAPANTSAQRWHYHYRCQNCGADYWRQRRINTQRYVCGHCRGNLQQIAIDPTAKINYN